MERLRILVLFGGCSSEHEVSLQSAHGVLTHMDPERYCPIPVGITREGAWYVYTGPLDAIPGGRWQREAACVPCTLRLDRGNRALVLLDGSGREVAFDLAFPVLHGRNGADGTVQGALELAGVPLVGCGTLSSALCMDKDRAHKLAALAGGVGGAIDYAECPDAYRLESAGDDAVTFTLIGHYIEQGAEETDTEFLTRRADGGFDSTRGFTIRLVNTENGWRVDEVHSPLYP